MSLEELRERVTNELVLHEGNVADWQWNRTGLPAEARDLGITDFFRLVDEVSRALNAQFGKILDLQATIKKVGADNRKQLSEVQIGGFALEAERLGLSRSFVTEQWVPRLMAQLPNPAPEVAPVPSTASGTLPTTPPPPSVPQPPITSPPTQAGETAETMRQKVRDILDDYKEHVPAQAIRALFRAISYDENALAEAVLSYLTTNFYASEKEPIGNSLREKLGSTDWRHLAWWDRNSGQGSVVPPPMTPPPPPAASQPPPPAAPPTSAGSSGWRDLWVALLVAGGLLGFAYLLLRGNKGADEAKAAQESARQTQQAASRRNQEEDAEKPKKRKKPRKPRQEEAATPPPDPDTKATATRPPSPREEPYDRILGDVGQYGERPAQKEGQWGLWRNGKWLILPVYDEIEVYNEGRARVSINGNSYYLDRYGDRIR